MSLTLRQSLAMTTAIGDLRATWIATQAWVASNFLIGSDRRESASSALYVVNQWIEFLAGEGRAQADRGVGADGNAFTYEDWVQRAKEQHELMASVRGFASHWAVWATLLDAGKETALELGEGAKKALDWAPLAITVVGLVALSYLVFTAKRAVG